MEYQVTKKENSKLGILISIAGEEYGGYRKKALDTIRKKAKVPGFREGKAPDNLILEQYKPEIYSDISERILKDNYDEIVKKEDFTPVDYVNILSVDTEEDSFKVDLEVDIFPAIEVGQYKGLSAYKSSYEVTEEEINKEIENLREKNAKSREGEDGEQASIGDTVNLNFEGFVNDEAFEGGKGENYDLKLGSGSFIGGFEDQIVGHTIGDEFDVNVTFPENYFKAELAGQPAVFKCKLNSIQKMATPDLDDEFAKDLEYDSLEDMKNKIKESIQTKEEEKIENEFRNELLEQVSNNSSVEIPESMIKKEIDDRLKTLEMELKTKGLNLETYMKFNKMTKESLEANMRPMAKDRIKLHIVLEEIAKIEKIEVSEEDIKEAMDVAATHYNVTREKLKELLEENKRYAGFLENLKVEIGFKKAVDLVAENATVDNTKKSASSVNEKTESEKSSETSVDSITSEES